MAIKNNAMIDLAYAELIKQCHIFELTSSSTQLEK